MYLADGNEPYVSIEEVLKTTNRLPFTDSEVEVAVSFIKKNRKKGLMTGLHPFMMDDVSEVVRDGILGISLDDIGVSVLYAKVDAGRGLFGGQKSAYASYVGSITDDALMPGTTYKTWMMAITAINNIYRSQGRL